VGTPGDPWTDLAVFPYPGVGSLYHDPVPTLQDRVLVVVPALNEEQAVGRVVGEIKAVSDRFDVLVVDDGSTDRTSSVARLAGAAVCTLPFTLGVGGAMRTGYRYALREGYGTVVQIDGDGQHDPTYIPLLIDGLRGCDVIIGARFAGLESYEVKGPRRWAMAVLATVLTRIAGAQLSDVTSGYRAVNRRGMQLFAEHYPSEYLGDTVESLVIAVRAGCRVRQVPVSMRRRTTGRASQGSLRSVLYLARAVVALGLGLIRRWPSTLEPLPQELV
jgi:glycosyltransferase involved in cell wall biosynthesis